MSDAAAAPAVLADTRRWLERAVIGLNLCPFAKAVAVKDQVHFAASEAHDLVGALDAFAHELDDLLARPAAERDTTLLVLPHAPLDFLSFDAWARKAERLVRKRGLEGVVQVAHFHPAFQFADAEADDITNFTNRAPYPILHLLREDSVARAVAAIQDAAAIYEANQHTLRRLGPAGWAALGVGASR
ncbi:DUF1415 domain-containing protein [Caenimonas sedimenti]|uniref:DUF1415 domain-containing protein n=1 Tax=Caenimonas sedimenti TaxID=2596921 RepID=UPI002105F090|nr:DUF1415 domain-containing protein [Caenimonas sedimenti]